MGLHIDNNRAYRGQILFRSQITSSKDVIIRVTGGALVSSGWTIPLRLPSTVQRTVAWRTERDYVSSETYVKVSKNSYEGVACGTRVSTSKDMVNALAVEYLSTLLGKQLRIHTTDTRMFVGEMKCTDGECNVILSRAHEYRAPPASAVRSAVSDIDADASNTQETVKVNMTSRFLGLVVVPGEFITKIELEEYQDVERPNDPS